MNSKVTIAALLVLAACGGNPFPADDSDDGGDGDTTVAVPEALARNVTGAQYNADDGTLKLAISGLDTSPVLATYERYSALDVAGYKAFKIQEDPLDRMFVALAAESADGSTRAVTASDGGQFGRYFAGGHYERDGNFDPPDGRSGTAGTGQVSYAGTYAAVQNVQGSGTDLLEPAPGTDPGLLPGQPRRVRGDIFLEANFADNLVNGSIYNRVVVDNGTRLGSVVLVATEITETGTFEGTTEPINDQVDSIAGSYGGIFGGTNSSSVAGLVNLTEFEDDIDLEQEHGVFVLTQCGRPNDAAICDQVAPN